MGGTNTISLYNRCEDSLLAAPLIIDLVVLAELCERITVRRADEPPAAAARFHSVLSLLSYLLKAPLVPGGAPVVNALFKQREALVNVLRACIGLPPENHMLLEHRLRSAGTPAALAATGLGLQATPAGGDVPLKKPSAVQNTGGSPSFMNDD